MNFKEWLKRHKYTKKGLKIGFILGVTYFLIITLSAMIGIEYMKIIIYYHYNFIYSILNNFNFFGGGIGLVSWFLSFILSIIFFTFMGMTCGFIVDKYKK